MKRFMFTIMAAAVVFSCGKADIAEPAHKGEAVRLSIPETKVGLNDNNYYVFEAGDVIIARAQNGSIAVLSNKDGDVNSFSGEFSEPLGSSNYINLYYNCRTEEGVLSYVQNGKPWLESINNSYERDTDNTIKLSAEFSAPAGVRTVYVKCAEANSFIFNANTAAVSSFDGSVFSKNGEKSISLEKNEGFINVPSGMTGGFWLKFTGNDGKVMYKSYASGAAIDKNYAVKIDKFVPVNVNLQVSITGFPTSYSYYVANEGIDGITAKDVATANSKSNSWIGDGKAAYKISCKGIPSKLLNFESFTLTVDGQTYKDDENSGTISVTESTGHNTWGQKDITATVTYKAVDDTEFTKTATVTRHITGLPYYNTQSFKLEGTGNPKRTDTFYVDSATEVNLTMNNIEAHTATWSAAGTNIAKLQIKIGDNDLGTICEAPNHTSTTAKFEQKIVNGELSKRANTIEMIRGGWITGTYVQVGSYSVTYR